MDKDVITAETAARELEILRTQQFHFAVLMTEKDITPGEVAMKLAKGNPHKAKMWRQRYRRWRQDPKFHQLMADLQTGELWMHLPRMNNALIRRASKGNVPAIKLAMEVIGFYSPKSTLDHTGEIAVTFKGLIRPEKVDDGDVEISDADVVEE